LRVKLNLRGAGRGADMGDGHNLDIVDGNEATPGA
jgi:hypothetical protein